MKKIIAMICLTALLAAALVSCGYNIETIEEKLEKEGYFVSDLDKEDIKEEDIEDLSTAEKLAFVLISPLLEELDADGVLIAVKSKGLFNDDYLLAVSFASKDDAKSFADKASSLNDVKVEAKGKIVCVGSEEAMKIIG